jgi:tetratricopeptide (TPR) repeat protein
MNFRFASLIWLVTLASFSIGEVAGQDFVYKDKPGGGTTRLRGKITAMTPEGVTIGDAEVAASEIRRIAVGKEPSVIDRLRDQMNAGRYAECLAGLAKLSDLPDEPLLRQEVDFMRAYSTAKLSTTHGPMDPKEAGGVVAKFLSDHPNSLHTYPALEQYGLLIYSFGKPAAAAKEFAKLKQAGWLEYRWRGYFWHGRMMQISGDMGQAKADYEAILAGTSNDEVTVQYQKLAKSELAKLQGLAGPASPAIAQLRALIKNQTASNPQLFANIYNAQGAIYEQSGQFKAARTAYLHTTLLFAGEAEEAAEASYRLAKLWPQLNQAGRANEARGELKSKFRNSYWARIVDKN